MLDAGLAGELLQMPEIAWSTYIGEGGEETVTDVTVDSYGNIFVSGNVEYGTPGTRDGFVSKLSPLGEPLWTSYLGGDSLDSAYAIATATDGGVVVAGGTSSRDWIENGYQTKYQGADGFVAKLDPTGTCEWSTYVSLGNNTFDSLETITVDPSTGDILAAGRTERTEKGVIQQDVLLAKISSDGQQLRSIQALGGSLADYARGIAIDSLGDVVIVGRTRSPSSQDWVHGGFDDTLGGDYDAFVLKLQYDSSDPSQIQQVWSTYLGGSDSELGNYDVAVDPNDNSVIVTASTFSSDWISTDYGWRQDGFDTTYNNSGDWDAFVAKLSAAGDGVWATYLGGEGFELGRAVVVDSNGDIFLTGRTDSNDWVAGGFDTTPNGGQDSYVAMLTAEGQHVWSSYLGGANDEFSGAIARDLGGNLVVAGETSSDDWVVGDYDTTLDGETDGFVAKIRLGPPPAPSFSIDDVEVVEGDSGTTMASFIVTRSGDSNLPVRVDFVTSDGTATEGSDYLSNAGTIYFDAGEVSKTIDVAVLGDVAEEAGETFSVDLTNAIGGTITDGHAVATIIDDDTVSQLIDVYIADICFESDRDGRDWRAVVEVLTVEGDKPVAGVTLQVDFAGTIYTVVTDSDGIARTSWRRNLKSGDYLADAYDLAFDDLDYSWTALAFDLENDSDGDGKPDDLLRV